MKSDMVQVFFLASLVMVIVVLYLYQRNLANREKSRQAAEKVVKEDARRHLLDAQDNLGNRIYNALTKAAAKNQNGDVRVEKIPQNGKSGYTVVVGWRDDTCFTYGGARSRGFHVISISLNLANLGSEIHTFESSYGPDTYYSLANHGIESLLATWSGMIETYTPYVKN